MNFYNEPYRKNELPLSVAPFRHSLWTVARRFPAQLNDPTERRRVEEEELPEAKYKIFFS